MAKIYFKNKLKYSKRSDHGTDDVMSLFWSGEKLSGRTLLSCKFSLRCDETSILHSPWPSLPTYSLMSITLLNFNAGRKLVVFKCLALPKTSNMLFVFNTIMKSCHSNQKNIGKSHVTDDVITLCVIWEDILWQVLSCCGLTFFYV